MTAGAGAAGRVAGKVALVTGAARGQGRSHALQLAREGADIVAVDACTDFDTISYPMATRADLAQTVKEIDALGRRVLAIEADVREYAAMREVVTGCLAEFGGLDVVVANAGICAMAPEQTRDHWVDVSAVNFGGVLNAFNAAVPYVRTGGSLVAIGSYAALRPDGPAWAGGRAYRWAKRALVDYVRDLARTLATDSVRVNGIHPTNVNTTMLQHEDMYRVFRPDLEHPGRDDAIPAFATMHPMPASWVEPADVSSLVLFLASEESRFVTGQFISCDAGAHLTLPG